MTYQNTYHRQSANQILADATIIETAAGLAEISLPEHPEWRIYQDDDGDLIIRDYDGIVVSLICGKLAQERLQALVAECETKQAELIRIADNRNATCYGDML